VRSGTANIGAQAGAAGTVSLANSGTLWEVQSGALVVGQNGTGVFGVSLGAHLLFDSGTVFSIGLNAGSHGTLTASGSGSLIDASDAIVAIGESAGSIGSVSLTDGAQFLTAQVFAVGDFGNGSLTISSASESTISGGATKVLIGNVAGSSGSVSVQGADSSLSVAGPMTVGVSGNGFLGAGTGGVIALDNADQVTGEPILIVGEKKGATGSVFLDGNGTKLTLAGPLLVGGAGAGSFTMSSGTQVIFPPGQTIDFALGSSPGGSGTAIVNGSSFVDGVTLVLGGLGAASFTATNNASVQIFGFSAPFGGSGGQATITVDGSSWTNTGNIYLGGLSASEPPSTLLVENDATMRVSQRMTIFQSGTVTIDTGGMMAVGSGDFGPAGSVRVSTGGILSGYGRVQGQVIVAAGGKIYPGDSPGILTVEGAYQQEAGSTYSVEIGGTTAGLGFDQISVTGAASLGGTLQVRLVNGFTPSVGQTFRIVNAASLSGAFGAISSPSQAGISLTSDATGVTATITSVVTGAPVISSATTANTAPGAPFNYQIAATNNPTSFGATNLPAGLTINNNTGLISGTPTVSGAFIVPINANNAAGSGQADLTLVVDPVFGVIPGPPSNLLNISTRLNVQSGDNVLIGGFIITGTDPKEVIVRGIGPSLGAAGVSGVLADPVLELHKPDGTIVTNDNWKDTQQTAITATGFAPGSDLESAILATLAPGAYTAILRGKNDGTGIGLVEAYDLDQAADSTLANISTRGLVETGDNVMIGGFIIGGGGGGASTVVLRAIGPSLGGAGVANALQNPTLELHGSDGAIVAENDDWMDGSDEQTISDDGFAPADQAESALLATLVPGAYTAIVRGAGDTTGVALVEAYNLQ
jgi:T5SS/PEP-CTERM-associated repeat protein